MTPTRSRGAEPRPDIAHPSPELPYRLRCGDHRLDRWQVVPDTAADGGDPQIGGW